ncbi:hypothetical protein M3Y99_01615400 [Aphelenchoides fujianensis]|nr:hypothetical protein M3Y99_01615400 [Aphelenchoides fujianensis]
MQMSFAERTWREEAIMFENDDKAPVHSVLARPTVDVESSRVVVVENRGRVHEIEERKGPSEKKARVPSTGSSLHTFNDHENKFLSDARKKKLECGQLERFCLDELRRNAADEEAIREAHDNNDLDNISVSSSEF